MSYQDIMKLIPTIQSVKLVEKNIKQPKKKTKDMIELGVSNIVGIELIKLQSNLI